MPRVSHDSKTFKSFCCACTLLATLCVLTASASAENWAGWRGPRGDGTSTEENIPTEWDGPSGKNIAWKVPIPGEGHSSPIVYEKSVFVASCLADNKERVLLCYDRDTGKLRWQKTVIKSPLETKHALNSYASGTPATDGTLVYISFFESDGTSPAVAANGKRRSASPGKMVVAAYDFDGNQKWLERPGDFSSVHGFSSNPVIFNDLVIVNGDHDGDSYIVALNKNTGETVWKQPRKHKTRSYVTPLIREIGGQPHMVFSGSMSIVSLDPRTGVPYWTIEGPTEQFVASMVYDGKQFYMACGFPDYHVMAIRPDGVGDVTKTHVAWDVTTAKCYVPSPVLAGNYLLVADDRGTGNCFDTATGTRFWQERMGTHYSGSLVVAGGRVYFIADDGVTKIVEPGKELHVIAENKLGEHTYSSPAISNGHIFIRGEKNLYCIGK